MPVSLMLDCDRMVYIEGPVYGFLPCRNVVSTNTDGGEVIDPAEVSSFLIFA